MFRVATQLWPREHRSIAGPYLAEELIDSGPTSFVYAARHRLLGRPVSVVLLRPEAAADPRRSDEFERQARILCRLRHENLIAGLDAGRDDRLAVPFLVLDHIEGATLADLIRDQAPLAPARATRILNQLARALAAAHAAGIAHGSLEPRHVLLGQTSGDRDLAVLTGFGLSMARRDSRDALLDLQRFGLIGFQMLTGRWPRDGESLLADRGIPRPLAGVVARCLVAEAQVGLSIADVEAALAAAMTSDPAASAGDLIGCEVGYYRITALLGAGAVGAVYLGEHAVIGTKVAIKVLHPWMSVDPAAVERFLRQARVANRIGGPSFPMYIDFGHLPGGRPYAVVEYLYGETLARRITRKGALDLGETRGIVRQVAVALGKAHAVGIAHGNIKPENLFLTVGEGGRTVVKVLDLGIAELASLEGASEQEDGPASDLVALAATITAMLGGCLPRPVAATVARMVARAPQDCLKSMGDVVRAIDAWRADQGGALFGVGPRSA